MNEWLQTFINPSFMPHGHCYLWRPDVLWSHVISDFVIGLSYYLIPVIMGVILLKRKNGVPYPEIFALFIAFIFFCGTTHFFSIYVTWYPAYAFQGWLKVLTAFVSLLTVIVLVPRLPMLISLPGIRDAYNSSQSALAALQDENNKMQSVYVAAVNREERIIELKNEVNMLLAELDRKPSYEV